MSHRTAGGLHEIQKIPKSATTSKFDQIVWLFTLKNTSNKKNVKKDFNLAKDVLIHKIWNQSQKKIRLEKYLFFWSPLFRQLCPKHLGFFYKIFFFLQNIRTLKKSVSSQPLSFVKRPSFLRVNRSCKYIFLYKYWTCWIFLLISLRGAAQNRPWRAYS